ncbi:unnamed protein product, partial [Adineta steineri]
FAPCIISQALAPLPMTTTTPMNSYTNEPRERRGLSLDDIDMKYPKNQDDNISLFDDETQDSVGLLINTSSPAKLKRNQSLQSPRISMISTSPPSRFPLSSSYARVTPSIQADLEIMHNLCQYYRELFNVSNDEIEHEKKCVEALISLRNNQCQPRKLNGTMVSVYFESRADELNGYAINILEHETTAEIVIDKLLNQIHKHDCFFWALFEVIIDQNLERPMYSSENISNVLNRYRTYLPQELNRQATFVVKLNYVQFEKERLQQQSQQQQQDLLSIECEYFDLVSKRWISCLWIYEKRNLQIHRISNEKTMKWKSRFTNSSTQNNLQRKESILNSSVNLSDHQTPIFSWFIEDIYLYIGADRRIVNPFDMNEYRTLTILHIDSINETTFGIAFRFNDRHQMFGRYLELARNNGHDQWTREASHTIPDGVNYLPLQNYHTPSSLLTPSRKKSEQFKTKLMAKSSHVASSFVLSAMFSEHHSSVLRKTRSRRRRSKRNQHQSIKSDHRTRINSPAVDRFHEILTDLKRPGSRFASYTINELEPICQQIAIQEMSSSTTTINIGSCPLVCIFCQHFIHEPITLYCGHTFCDQCINDEQLSSTINCPRCPHDIQGQVQSPIVHAREKSYRKNLFLHQLFDRSETLQTICENITSCRKGKKEYSKGNYQQAINIYSQILDKNNHDHLALYNRAKAYAAIKQFNHGLTDATHVVALKPHWTNGYICQGEILFDMNHFTAALRSSLKGLVIDPDNQMGKQTMARHLHAVLHNDDNNTDDKEIMSTMKKEFEQINKTSLVNETIMETMNSMTDTNSLTMCKSIQSSNSCFCLQFNSKKLNSRDFECSICVSLLWIPITTPCGHVFCRECLIRSVDNTQAQCPICKSSLEEFFPMLIRSYVNKTEIISKLIETYFPKEYHERQQLYEQDNIQGVSIPPSLINNTESTIFEIPIFVCVLILPHCACPLHVYEPRYRLMMRRANETETRTFGMCQFDGEIDTFADYGTLLHIRGLIYTPDGRSIVDTIGQRRFRVIERGMKDEYHTARVELIRDHQIEEHEFNDLFQFNRDTYNRVREWFDNLDSHRKTLIRQQVEEYPSCDDLIQGLVDGPSWTWIMLNVLPIEPILQYTALASQSLRIRLQMINDTIDFQLNQQQQQQQQQQSTTIISSNDDDDQ